MMTSPSIPRALAAILLALGAQAQAQVVGLHVATWHDKPGFSGRNPGVYISTGDGWTAGAYRNSYGRGSAYAGRMAQIELAPGVSAGVLAGAVTGYPRKAVLPLVLPSVSVRLWGQMAVRATVLPRPPWPDGAAGVHLSLETGI